MAKTSVMKSLYDLLDAKDFSPVGIVAGRKSNIPEEATGFNFVFRVGDKKYGSCHIAIDNINNLTLFYNNSSFDKVSREWLNFIEELKSFGRENDLRWKTDNLDSLPHYYIREKKNSSLNEGYYGTKTTSYHDSTPQSVKLIIRHNKSLDENDQRFRHVERIFVENEIGERFALVTKRPTIGYIHAINISNGGNPYDERGKHINQLEEDYVKLSGFIKATKNNQFNESLNTVISQAVQRHTELKETIKKLKSKRGFANYFENWKPMLVNEEQDISVLENAFLQKSIDPRIHAALPVLSKFNISVTSEQFNNSKDEEILDEDLEPYTRGQIEELINILSPDSESLPLGPHANNAIGELVDYIDQEDLFDRLKSAAEQDPNTDARFIVLGWMAENQREDESYEEILQAVEKKTKESGTQSSVASTVPSSPPEPQTSMPNLGNTANSAANLPKVKSDASVKPDIKTKTSGLAEEDLQRIRQLMKRLK